MMHVGAAAALFVGAQSPRNRFCDEHSQKQYQLLFWCQEKRYSLQQRNLIYLLEVSFD